MNTAEDAEDAENLRSPRSHGDAEVLPNLFSVTLRLCGGFYH